MPTPRALLLVLFVGVISGAEVRARVAVGLEARVLADLPAGLTVTGVDHRAERLLRIAARTPLGAGRERLDLRFIALRPGRHDLGELLCTTDGSTSDLPPLMVLTHAQLAPEAAPGALAGVDPGPLPRLGGYHRLLHLLAVLWLALPLGLVLVRALRRRRPAAPPPASEDVRTRLRRLLAELAADPAAAPADWARVDRLIRDELADCLALGGADPAHALAAIRADPRLGALYARLAAALYAANNDTDALDAARRAERALDAEMSA
ncbi:MAG: hypothetical protein ACOCYP_03290 [Planctomycetota bacterium]